MIPLNDHENNGESLLHIAVKSGSLPIVTLLIKAGAYVNIQDVI